MDFIEKDMLKAATEMFKNTYSEREGWNYHLIQGSLLSYTGLVIQKDCPEYIEKILVLIITECQYSQHHIDNMDLWYRESREPGVLISKRFIVFPAGVIPQYAGSDIDFVFLDSYICNIEN